MRIALIGVGQAGGKIVDRVVAHDDQVGAGFITGASVINTARTDLHGLEHVPKRHRVLIGQERTKGHGVGADNELGADIADQNRREIMGALDTIPVANTDAFLVVAALGGGTGSGAAPLIARDIRAKYSEPVYGLGVLPAHNEGGIYSLNAARSLRTFVREVDNFFAVDNDAWRRPDESIEAAYADINDEIARRFVLLFSAGEIEPRGTVAENVVDSSEIINTLDSGGVTSVGHATDHLGARGGLLARFRRNGNGSDQSVSRIYSLVKRATRGRLTLPCDVRSTDRALILVTGPPKTLSRQGIERAREWLEGEAHTVEIRGGDYPMVGASSVSATVVLSGVTEAARIDELQEMALDVQERLEDRDRRRAMQVDALVTDEQDELDPLF